MDIRIVKRHERRLPEDDDHPYRTGAWRPNLTEYDAFDLEVLAGEIPRDLEGVYLRNTENPLFPSIGRYHPFDGDGMIHAVHFHDGRADYRNRFVATKGLAAEIEAGRPLWAGLMESPAKSEREGWGARTRLKDASSTDVVVHRGTALSTHYQCGDAYEMDPITLEQRGPAKWGGRFPSDWGISAHAKADENTGELLFFTYSKKPPFMRYGVVDRTGEVVHYVPIPLPGPRLPHDMAFTENYAILCDFPLFWDAALLEKNVHRLGYHPELGSRFAVIPRRGDSDSIRWFTASPTFVLHFMNAYEEGNEIVLDGYHEANPLPIPRASDGPYAALMRMVDLDAMKTSLRRWRFDLSTGTTKEETLDDRITEFPTINGRYWGRKNRYGYAMTGEPGWFLFNGVVKLDHATGARQAYAFPKGVFASESPMAPRIGSTAEDDGYLLTLVSDVPNDRSECRIFRAQDIHGGPIARLRLPERICSGTHSCWVASSDL